MLPESFGPVPLLRAPRSCRNASTLHDLNLSLPRLFPYLLLKPSSPDSTSVPLLDEILSQGVAHDLGVALEIEFDEEASSIRANGFAAQFEIGRDFFDTLSSGDHTHDLVFASGEGIVQSSSPRLLQGGNECIDWIAADLPPAGHDFRDSRNH